MACFKPQAGPDMNNWKTIALLARRSLITLALSILCAFGIFFGTVFFKDRMVAQRLQAQQLESAQRASLEQKDIDLKNLQAETGRFSALRQQGLLGNPDRAAWVEQLLASYQALGLSMRDLAYTMHPPQALLVSGPDAAPAAPTDQGARTYDLDFTMTNTHEEDVLALLGHVRIHVKGLYRVQACHLSGPKETGLTARCTLRFFNMPESALKDAQPTPVAGA